MSGQLLLKFGLRWLVSSLGLWIAVSLLGPERMSLGDGLSPVIWAGFFLALVNMALKPLLIIMSFPAIVLSLGLFMLVINALLILLVDWIYSPLYVKNFGVAIAAGIIVGLVNFLVSQVVEKK